MALAGARPEPRGRRAQPVEGDLGGGEVLDAQPDQLADGELVVASPAGSRSGQHLAQLGQVVAVGVASGCHRSEGHPVLPPDSLINPCLEGEILFELEGQPPRVLEAGEPVFEPGGDVIHYQGANNLADAQSQLVVTMFAPPGTPLLTVVSPEELAERRHLRFTRP